MKIEQFPAGPLDTNGYLVSHEGKCLVVDPSLNPRGAIAAIQSRGLELEAILLTHAHFDHFLGIDQIIATFGDRPIWLHDADRFILTDPEKNGATWVGITSPFTRETIMYTEGTNTVGSFTFEAFFTPGHTPGGLCLLFGNDCLTGDTLFRRSVGRSDFPYSDTNLLFRMIEEKLLTLPAETIIWPGHGDQSTIGAEIRHNPYLR